MSATYPVIVKTLKKEEFTFHVSPDDTVLSLKQQIEKQLHHEVAAQKLIFTGKILVDTQTIKSAEIQEGNFLVLLTSARKAGAAVPPAAASPTATPAAAPTPAVTPAAAAPTTPAPTSTPPASTTTTPSAAPAEKPAESPASTPASLTALENDLATGSDYEAKITELVSMGFDRNKAVAAMEAAFNNVNRAAEYLINGIPSHLRSRPAAAGSPHISPPSPTSGGASVGVAAAAAAAAGLGAAGAGAGAAPLVAPPSPGTPPAAAAGAGGAAAGGGDSLWDAATAAQTEASAEGGSGALDFLRNLPYFNQLRLAVQANPGVLPLILQQLAQTQPQVLQLIQAHQQEFINLLSEPVGAPSGPQVVQIQLTPEESQSVQNLIALGFDRNRVLQAFLACDKNEDAAANFLLENAAEDDEDLAGGAGGDPSGGLDDDSGDFF